MQIQKRPFLRALKSAARVVPNRPTLPILDCLLIRDHKITASDLTITVQIPLPGMADPNAPTFCVNADDFINAVDRMPGDDITLSLDGNTITVRSGKAKVQLLCEQAEDFPVPPVPTKSTPVNISAETMNRLCKIAALHKQDDIRQWPGATALIGKTAVFTDAHRLITIPLEEPVAETMVIPTKVWKVLEGIGISDSILNGNMFETQAGKVYFRTLELKYPDYNAVIPVSPKNRVGFIIEELREALKVVITTANKTTFQVVFEIVAPNVAKAWTEDVEWGKSAEYECQISTNIAVGQKFAFNGNFLAQLMDFLPDAHTVDIQSNSHAHPHLLNAADQDGILLLMPVMINEY